MKKSNLKTVLLTTVLILTFCVSSPKALGGSQVTPMVIVCPYELAYSETVSSLSKVIQWMHAVDPSVTQISITKSVTIIKSVSIVVGAGSDFSIFGQKTNIHFELGYVGTKNDTFTQTWNVDPHTQTIYLRSGKYFQTVYGSIEEINTNCSYSSRVINVRGTKYGWTDSSFSPN